MGFSRKVLSVVRSGASLARRRGAALAGTGFWPKFTGSSTGGAILPKRRGILTNTPTPYIRPMEASSPLKSGSRVGFHGSTASSEGVPISSNYGTPENIFTMSHPMGATSSSNSGGSMFPTQGRLSPAPVNTQSATPSRSARKATALANAPIQGPLRLGELPPDQKPWFPNPSLTEQTHTPMAPISRAGSGPFDIHTRNPFSGLGTRIQKGINAASRTRGTANSGRFSNPLMTKTDNGYTASTALKVGAGVGALGLVGAGWAMASGSRPRDDQA